MKKLILLLFLIPNLVTALPSCPEDKEQVWDNCLGEKEIKIEDEEVNKKFNGEWKNNKPHNQGTATYPDGRTYVGEWKNAKAHGQGTATHSDGRTYVGEFKNGKPNGQGTATDSDGRTYVGEWKNAKPNGQGTFTYPDGRTYVGEWKNALQNGQGTQTYPDGSAYVGSFKDENRHGQGMLNYPDGSSLVGEWKNNILLKDKVTLTLGNTVYIGSINEKGLPQGQGKEVLHNGTIYFGDWKNGKIIGQITVSCPDGQTLTGEYLYPKEKEPGSLILPDGSTYLFKDKIGSC